MKLRNSLAILCSAAFCFALSISGCKTNHKNPEGTTWTVSFDSKGGTAVPSQTVKDGAKAVKPTNPTKEGYTFVNWYEDSSAVTPFDFSIAITADWTLYAGWQMSDTPIPPDPPQPTTYDYYINIGGVETGLESVNKDTGDPDNLVAKYHASVSSVTAGQAISFRNQQSETVRPGSDAEDDTNKNNISGDYDNGYTIHNDATNIDVYFKQWQDGYSFWITGYQGGVVPSITYTCTGLPNWITNDGCVIFVWAWGNTDGGSWHEATFINSGAALTFEVNDELNGFLLVRCVSGTTQPDWSIKSGNNPGRIYNKTNDIACSAGTYSYVCSNWVAYNG